MRTRKLRGQSGGAVEYKLTGIQFVDMNATMADHNLIGLDAAPYNIHKSRFLNTGVMTNPSAQYHEHAGKKLLIGVARGMNRPSCSNYRTGTTIKNKHPMDIGHPWGGGWKGDFVLFYIYDTESKVVKYFVLDADLQEILSPRSPGIFKFYEDPRICISYETNTVLFYVHKSYGDVMELPNYSKGLDSSLNIGAKWHSSKKSLSDNMHLPYVAWIKLENLNGFIDHCFTGTTVAALKCEPWRPLCSQYLTYHSDKNWVIIPNGDNFDFMQSMGAGLSKNVIILRLPISNLRRPVVLASGAFDDNSHSQCTYIETLTGTVKTYDTATKYYGLKVESQYNSEFEGASAKINFILKRWLNILMRLLVEQIPTDNTYKKIGDFAIKRDGTEVKFTYPFIDQDGRNTQVAGNVNDYQDLKIKILNGISTGGTACKTIGSDSTMYGVGHLKFNHAFVYFSVIAAGLYSRNVGFKAYVESHVGSTIAMTAAEKTEFLKFIEYIVSKPKGDSNMLLLIYSYFHNKQVYNPYYTDASISHHGYRKLNSTHHNLAYTSFIFSFSKDSYKLKRFSGQLLFKNPTDEFDATLQFGNTITSNNKDTYYIPYGHLDGLARTAIIPRKGLDDIMGKSADLKPGVDLSTDFASIYEMITKFLTVNIVSK